MGTKTLLVAGTSLEFPVSCQEDAVLFLACSYFCGDFPATKLVSYKRHQDITATEETTGDKTETFLRLTGD